MLLRLNKSIILAMNSFEIRWDPRAVIGIPVVTLGLSLAVVGANCLEKLPEVTVSTEGKAACMAGNFKFLDPNAHSFVTVSGTSGTTQQMSMMQSADVLDSARAVVDLSKLIFPASELVETLDYLA